MDKVRRVIAGTLNKLAADRAVGLAGEAAFFALLSIPPLALALTGTLGYFHSLIGAGNIADIQDAISRGARAVLARDTVQDTVDPTVHDVLSGGRADVVSIGFVIALWSGSRAMSTYMDAITIAYDLQGRRSWLTKRVLAYAFFLAAVMVSAVLVPLLIVGPHLVARGAHHPLGDAAGWIVAVAYWPVVVVLSIVSLATLYHVAVPIKKPWRRALPGAVFALLVWVIGSYILRIYFAHRLPGSSAYGALAAPVAVMIWLWVTAMAIIVGAELNAQIDAVWPPRARLRSDFLGSTQRRIERRLGVGGGPPPSAVDKLLQTEQPPSDDKPTVPTIQS
jgi:membrane protein